MPVLPFQLCLPGIEVTDVLVRPGGQWVSGVVSDGASAVLRMWAVDGSAVIDLFSDGPSRGRGLSGGAHVWADDGEVVYVATEALGIVEITLRNDGVASERSLAFDASRSWSTPAIDYMNRTVFAIADWKELWGCDIADGEPYVVHDESDFALDAIAGVDGSCIVWNRPDMAWTQSAVLLEAPTSGIAAQQPRFSRTKESFGFIDDSTGVANVHILGDLIVDPNISIIDHCEHGAPTWGPGQRTWCFNTDGTRVAYTRNEDGYSSLWVFDRVTGSRHRIGHGVHGCLSWEGNTLAALRTGARTPQQVVVYQLNNLLEPRRTVLVRPADARLFENDIDAELVEPTVERAPGDVEVPYRLYRPHRPHGGLICWVHGGPNEQWQVTFRSQFTYWLSRGFAIAVVDHRGSSGHGREFMMSLNGHWGEYDAIDTANVLRHLHGVHGYSATTTVLMGGSAGGLTALNTAVRDASLCAGVVVKYPVVDLVAMLHSDDPFEGHYMPTLIGSKAQASERSPHNNAAALAKTPILVFHGDQDHSVPLLHSERLRDAVLAVGGNLQLEVFAGEGHGFRNPVNIAREFTVTEDFLHTLMKNAR
ncbi:MAG: alpha/beta hydrolase family protein [Ilumatobacteraceae bacterium]